jgi:hypothetical protein
MVKKRGLNDAITVEEGIIIESQETTNAMETEEINEEEAALSLVETEDPDYNNLLSAAQEIRKRADIFGYILRGDTKATVDLGDPAKIVEYAMLSSQAFECSEALAQTFQLGATENVLIEGKDLKVLCIDHGQNKISIFMQKETDHAELLKTFTPQE